MTCFDTAIDTLFNDANMAADAVYNAGATIPVLFQLQYIEALPDQDGFGQRRPTALVRNSDVPSLAIGDTFQIGAITYTARILEPDDDGTTLVVMRT